MALTPSEVTLIDELHRSHESNAYSDELLLRYYLGQQRVEQLGMAIPTAMRKFLVIANWPPVDLDDLSSAEPEDLLNVGTSYTYEPGSTFKAFTVASALQDKTVSPTSTFTLAPTIQIFDRTIEESHPRGTVTLDVGGILAQSSNVGAVTIGLEIGARKFSKWIKLFKPGLPVCEKSSPYIVRAVSFALRVISSGPVKWPLIASVQRICSNEARVRR